MAVKVKLRQKKISGNRLSLYLDFYPQIQDPKTLKLTRREFLGLYIHQKPKTPLDKQHNKETQQVAEQIRQQRENQINKPEVYSNDERRVLKQKEQGEQNFVEYFRILANKRKASNHDNWVSALKYLENFTAGTLKIADINERFCEEFKEHLLSTKSNKRNKTNLSQNSAVSYFNKFKAALRQAFKDGLLSSDIKSRIESIKPAEVQRSFLTIDELNRLIKTECNNLLLKNAALFSALTGLRFSDIQKLTWADVHHSNEYGYALHYRQKKTKGVEVLPISEQAFQLMGKRRELADKVFEGLTYSAYENKHLYQWIGAAGITKDITFHCFRHTFATLQLSKGTDITTVSKMLGHRDLKTTQIYAKIVDQSKRNAADKIKLDF
jgi:integrase